MLFVPSQLQLGPVAPSSVTFTIC